MRFWGAILCFCVLFAASANAAVADFAYTPEWLAVGHYQVSGSGYKSTIDSENYFLAADGKVNPQSELEATIALFSGDNKYKKCLCPSRDKLLQKAGLVTAKYPHCVEYEQFYDDLRPAGVTLLFTDAYMNNPSSLFGHTLLRIDTARKGTQLLAHGANYGVAVWCLFLLFLVLCCICLVFLHPRGIYGTVLLYCKELWEV